jgi:hypothetical protein
MDCFKLILNPIFAFKVAQTRKSRREKETRDGVDAQDDQLQEEFDEER